MTSNKNKSDTLCSSTANLKYKLVAPDGQWGYIITIGVAVMFIVTVSPLCVFGIVYGEFLAQLGNEGSATTFVTCIFNTVASFMGLVANRLYKSYSYRVVGVWGSVTFFLGNFLTLFTTTLLQITITFGVLQGIGFGLMVSACFSSFNEYFVARRNVMMSVCQTIISAVTMLLPLLARYFMDTYGYRGTVALFAALSLHTLLAMISLQPVRKHMRRVTLTETELENVGEQSKDDTIDEKKKLLITVTTADGNEIELTQVTSGTSSDDKTKSTQVKKWRSIWESVSNLLELSLLKDPVYVNIVLGLSFSFISDIMFLSVAPMLLSQMNFSARSVAFLMTLYLGSDLAGRVLLSLVSGFVSIKSRTLYLFGTLSTIVLRIAFTMCKWRYGTIVLMVLMGATRCLIQVLVPLVLAEYPRYIFAASYGMYMTISGILFLLLAPISSGVASLSSTGVPVVHLFTIFLLLCGVPWLLELTISYFRQPKTKDLNEREITPQ